MAPAKLASPSPGHFAVLRIVLENAAQTVPEAARTPSVMACLAEKILALAARGETDPVSLERLALETMRRSCEACYGCEGLQPQRRRRASSDAAVFNRTGLV